MSRLRAPPMFHGTFGGRIVSTRIGGNPTIVVSVAALNRATTAVAAFAESEPSSTMQNSKPRRSSDGHYMER